MQIFWVNMIVRPFIKYHPFLQYNKVVELKNTFNELLKEVAGKYDCNEIIESNLSLHEELFDSFGNLTFKGKRLSGETLMPSYAIYSFINRCRHIRMRELEIQNAIPRNLLTSEFILSSITDQHISTSHHGHTRNIGTLIGITIEFDGDFLLSLTKPETMTFGVKLDEGLSYFNP